jgi:hypothetical protein
MLQLLRHFLGKGTFLLLQLANEALLLEECVDPFGDNLETSYELVEGEA